MNSRLKNTTNISQRGRVPEKPVLSFRTRTYPKDIFPFPKSRIEFPFEEGVERWFREAALEHGVSVSEEAPLGLDEDDQTLFSIVGRYEDMFSGKDLPVHIFRPGGERSVGRLNPGNVNREVQRRRDGVLSNPAAMYILGKINNVATISLEALTENLTAPYGWLAFAQLWRADLVGCAGEYVYSTKEGEEFYTKIESMLDPVESSR